MASQSEFDNPDKYYRLYIIICFFYSIAKVVICVMMVILILMYRHYQDSLMCSA